MIRLLLIAANPDGTPQFIERPTLPDHYTDYVRVTGKTGSVLVGHEARVWTPTGRYSEALDAYVFEHIPSEYGDK